MANFLKISPGIMLGMLTLTNLIIYIDRGALSAVIPILKSKNGLDLNSLEAGTLGSVFMFGYMMSSPIFAYYSDRVHPFYLMAIGNSIWAGAVLFTGLSFNYPMILAARSFTGIGEASFVCLAPPCILDIAPKGKQSQWIGIFYSSSALGYALGFIYGNLMSELTGSWIYVFLLEALFMIPFIFANLACYKDPKLFAQKENDNEQIYEQIWTLLKIPVFVLLCLGNSCFQFTIGGVAFWGPDFLESFYKISGTYSSLSLGVITVLCGIIGTYAGSIVLDLLVKKYQNRLEGKALNNMKVEKSSLIISGSLLIGMSLGISFLFISVLFPLPYDVIVYIIGIFFAEFFSFLTTSPLAMAIMYCVPTYLRGQSNAVNILILHILGDFPSPTVIGAWFQSFGMFWGMFCALSWSSFGVIFWGLAWNVSRFPSDGWNKVFVNFFRKREDEDFELENSIMA